VSSAGQKVRVQEKGKKGGGGGPDIVVKREEAGWKKFFTAVWSGAEKSERGMASKTREEKGGGGKDWDPRVAVGTGCQNRN